MATFQSHFLYPRNKLSLSTVKGEIKYIKSTQKLWSYKDPRKRTVGPFTVPTYRYFYLISNYYSTSGYTPFIDLWQYSYSINPTGNHAIEGASSTVKFYFVPFNNCQVATVSNMQHFLDFVDGESKEKYEFFADILYSVSSLLAKKQLVIDIHSNKMSLLKSFLKNSDDSFSIMWQQPYINGTGSHMIMAMLKRNDVWEIKFPVNQVPEKDGLNEQNRYLKILKETNTELTNTEAIKKIIKENFDLDENVGQF